ncbi:MAG: mechanosensitive ion channel [Planctomycetes bacterium]|nr:mechanosensitive ion channel [Planctomycetota bacterium]
MPNLMLLAQAAPTEGVVDAGRKVVEAGRDAGDKAITTVTDVAGGTGQQLSAAGAETWDKVSGQITEVVGTYLPNLAAAVTILIVGWFAALLVAWAVRAAIHKLGIDKRIARSLPTDAEGESPNVSRGIGRGVFWVIMLIVAVAFFQALGLTMVTEPLQGFLNQVFEYAPRFIAAGVLLFVAWIVARFTRFVVSKALTASKIDRRLTREAGVDSDGDLPLTKTISEATYWLVFLFFLPAILSALAVPGLLAPVQNVVTQIMGFLPNVFAAAVILGIGWFVARIVRRITANLLAASGADRLGERVGITKVMGDNKLSGVVAFLVYILILVPVIVGSLNALQIAAVTQPASDMLHTILATLPGIFAAVLVVGVAYVVGRVVSGMARNMLSGIGFDKLPARLGLARETTEGRRTPSQIAGAIVMVAIVLFATMQALPMLGFDLLAGTMSQFLGFASQVLVGLVIFGFGLYVAKWIADVISDSGIANASLLSNVARAAILVLAGAMGLQHMGLAPEIVNLAFGITLGAIAVASAIAFGIGGRDAAKTLVDGFVHSRGPAKVTRKVRSGNGRRRASEPVARQRTV